MKASERFELTLKLACAAVAVLWSDDLASRVALDSAREGPAPEAASEGLRGALPHMSRLARYRGIPRSVAADLGLSPSYVYRVAKGKHSSARVERALLDAIAAADAGASGAVVQRPGHRKSAGGNVRALDDEFPEFYGARKITRRLARAAFPEMSDNIAESPNFVYQLQPTLRALRLTRMMPSAVIAAVRAAIETPGGRPLAPRCDLRPHSQAIGALARGCGIERSIIVAFWNWGGSDLDAAWRRLREELIAMSRETEASE